VTGELHPLEWDVGPLLAAGKEIPRLPEPARKRALLRARAALASRTVSAADAAGAMERRRWQAFLALAACLAFLLGASGTALVLRGARRAAAAAAEASAARP
jgi:hypothetical protein